MDDPERILADAFRRASKHVGSGPAVADDERRERVRYVARCQRNRAGVRLLMTCLLAKAHRPNELDVRKPYTEIGDEDSFSGRAEYDEKHIGPFIAEHDLPCNSTTAFLTPALRNIDRTLSPEWTIVGKPRRVYEDAVELLDDVHNGRESAKDVLVETLRQLVVVRQEQEARVDQLLEELSDAEESIPLSSEEIIGLIEQHLNSPKSSRLPVLVVAAAYQAARDHLGEQVRSLHAHNAADLQTGALGDVEITLAGKDDVVTSYEMKAKEVTTADVDRAIEKVSKADTKVDNYIFITTDTIDEDVQEYARDLYRETGGIEFAILDCIGFVRHFLHLFHRLRTDFLEAYQQLVLDEPESAVSQPLKEVFLNLRRAAETDSSA